MLGAHTRSHWNIFSFFILQCVPGPLADLWLAFCAQRVCLGTEGEGAVQRRGAAGGLATLHAPQAQTNNRTHSCRCFATLQFDSWLPAWFTCALWAALWLETAHAPQGRLFSSQTSGSQNWIHFRIIWRLLPRTLNSADLVGLGRASIMLPGALMHYSAQ